jgi:Plasmid pRiA4b ORF-3-like protein
MAKNFTLRAQVDHIKPPIWRVFEFPGRYTLKRLHPLLQILFGWNDSHLHEFEIQGELYTDPEFADPYYGRGELDESVPFHKLVKKGSSFSYRYDFGDSWQVSIKVVDHRPLEAGERPICLDGKRAGPLDDCGGTTGYEELCEVLRNPNCDEYISMRTWAGKWAAEEFDLERINKRISRRFPSPKKKLPPQQPDARIGPYLACQLSIRQQMAAALLESDEPLSLEQLTARLKAAGTVIPSGVTSLKRAWRRMPPLRETFDGKLEIETYHPDFKFLQLDLERSLPREEPKVVQKTTPKVPDPQQPISWALLREALKHGRPAALSRRRVLLLLLDGFGGSADLSEVLERSAKIEPRAFTTNDIELSLRGQDCMKLEDGRLVCETEHPDLAKARLCLLDWWYPLEATLAERAGWSDRSEEREEKREREYQEQRQKFLNAKKALLATAMVKNNLSVALLEFPSMRNQIFSAGQGKELRQALQQLDLVVGLDAKRVFEKLGLDCRGKVFIDITPTFLPVAKRRDPAVLAQVIHQTVPVPYPIKNVSPDALLTQARVLHAYYRFGVQHGAVLRRDYGVEFEPVRWNLGLDLPLHNALRYCIEWERPISIALDPGNPLCPQEWEREFLPTELLRGAVRGCWPNSQAETIIGHDQIFSFSGRFKVPLTTFAFFE